MRAAPLLSRICAATFMAALMLCPSIAVADAFTVEVVDSSPGRIVLEYTFADPTLAAVEIDGQRFLKANLGREPVLKTAGLPELPLVAESIILSDVGTPEIRVLDARWRGLHDVDFVPSKGPISRQLDPARVPYPPLAATYSQDALFPAAPAELGTPYILRDFRGVTVKTYPIQYNPARHEARICDYMLVEITTSGTGGINPLDPATPRTSLDTTFNEIYGHHFLNFDEALLRYDPLNEDGNLLIICHDAWLPNIQPLVNHKNMRGIPTTAVGVSTIGNNATAIKAYIQNVYDTSDLAYVLLVGDAEQVATPSASGGASDPTYSKLAGSDDYPEIIIGRFAADTAAQVDTQVARTLTYETTPAPTTDWFWKGTGIASAQGAGQGDEGQADYVHMDEIRDWLLAFGYTEVDQIYDTNGGNAQQVTDALNEGRGVINYCGHGSPTSWGTTGFNNSDIFALQNDNMLPFIITVACNNGEFDNYDPCFAEAWLQATNGGIPTGAIGCYASSISQSWAPPMEAQDEFNLLLTGEAYVSYGALCYAGSCSMMDDYGSSGVSMFNTWHLFGDPTLRITITCTDEGTITLDSAKYACEDVLAVSVIDCGLNLDDEIIDTAVIDVFSTTEPEGEQVTITELGPASGQFEGTLQIAEVDGDGILAVMPGDTITAQYVDEDDGQGGYNVVVTDTALVDCTGPTIDNVQTIDIEPRSATVVFDSDEIARGIVHYGLDCESLTEVAMGGFSGAPAVPLSGLQDSTTYYYMVEAEDEAGNVTADPQCYSFTTPEVPDFFTELFESSDNDLDYLSLTFAPNGSVDYYAGCTEEITMLPTDPAGGTPIVLSLDDYETITLPDEVVWLYGVSYSQFHVSSKAYITFESGDTTWTESLENHFEQPRISGLFDDLNPSSSGSVSYKLLSDRVAVTWLNIPEYGASNQNTVQIEMFFDGTIRISYLNIDATDGLAGLSEGEGVDPDYFESDLSNMGSCGPRPPSAAGAAVQTPVNTDVEIELVATDDGLPDPPGALTFYVMSLPAHGTLLDGACGPIEEVPHEVCGGNVVVYDPDAMFSGVDTFTFKANDGGEPPAGGDSNIATVEITVGGPQAMYTFMLDDDPAWPIEGQWEFGIPTGQGGSSHGNPDPTSGATGPYVYGVNLNGDYSTTQGGPYYLTLGPVTMHGALDCSLMFQRWLNSDYQPYVTATIEVSTDGSTWTTVWDNGTSSIADAAWQPVELDLSNEVDGADQLYVRWGYAIGSGAFAYSGWNIDDIEIWGMTPFIGPDMNCDGAVDFDDINPFVLALSGEAAYNAAYPDCNWLNGDCNNSGDVDFDDINCFVEALQG